MDEKSRIEKYQKAIKYFENDIKNSNNPIYISWAKEMIEVYKELSKSKDNNKQNNDTIKDNNTDLKKVTVNEEDKELIDYFDKYVYAENTIEFNNIEKELKDAIISKNNKELDNSVEKYLNFVDKYNLDKKYMYMYFEKMFKMFDTDKLYIYDVKDIFNGQKVSDINDNKKLDEIMKDSQNRLDNLESNNYKEYIENEIVKSDNKNLDIEFQRLVNNLKGINMPNDVMVETFFKNYKSFIETNQLNEKFMLEYITDLMGTLDKDNNYVPYINDLYNGKTMDEIKNSVNKNNTTENTNDDLNKVNLDNQNNVNKDNEDLNTLENELEEELGHEPIKIVSTKKTTMGKPAKIILTALALSTVFNPVTALANASFVLLGGTAIGYGIYKSYKNKKYRKEDLARVLKHFDIDIREDGKIIDKDGNVITEERVGRERYEEIRSSLKKLGALENKLINPSYAKNKLTSMYLNNGLVKKVKRSFKDKKERRDYINKQETYLGKVEAEKELKKGMGRF